MSSIFDVLQELKTWIEDVERRLVSQDSAAAGVGASSVNQDGAQTTRRDRGAPAAEHNPAVDLPTAFPAGQDLGERIGEALKHIDKTVDWRATWDKAIVACYAKTRANLNEEESKGAWVRLANVADKLSRDGDFPPPGAAEILEAFAWAFDNQVVAVVYHEPEEPAPISEPLPESDETIPFGEET